MPAGRPLKYNNCLDLDGMCHLYFEECEEKEQHPTVAGLAYFLDVDRKTITNYQKNEEYFPTIKRAKAYIEAYLEQRLYGTTVTGVIFNLKNNFDWKDKQELEHAGRDGGPIETKVEWTIQPVKPIDET